ncbi:hypothetical protein HY734_01050 [Candidatus Uhrbacteria bacterium]|nr:hypothetical protein [Candidatus Uhrbacteria bacterium]
MDPAFLSFAILASLAGTVFAALVALLGVRAHHFAHILLAFSGAVGAVASIAFVVQDFEVLEIASVRLFFGMTFALDVFSAIFFAIVGLVSCLCSVYAIAYVRQSHEGYHIASLNAATALFVLGMQGVLLSTNVLGFMAFWELMSITSFFLVMADRKPASIKAALFYFVMTHLGAAAILTGFFVLAQGTILADFRTLAFSAQVIPAPALALTFFLFLFGFGSKAGLVPFHAWLPEAHPQAPSHISALMSGVMLKVAVYGFLRMMLFLIPSLPATFGLVIIGLGLASAIFGALYAVIERDIKRVLAFSSIENIGIIFTMIGVGAYAFANRLPGLLVVALLAAVFHCVSHALFKSGLFLAAGAIVHATGTRSLERMGGLAKRMPLLSGAFLVLALSAAALPPFGPFYGEWMFLQSLVQSLAAPTDGAVTGVLVLVLFAVVLASALAIFAMVKLFGIATLGAPRSEAAEKAVEPPASMNAPILLLALLLAWMGVFAPALVSLVGGKDLVSAANRLPAIEIVGIRPDASLVVPAAVFLGLLACLGLVFLLRRLLSDAKRERSYHTWNCGQPIDASMEYTATAFSAPIRFFFRFLLRTKNTVVAIPVVATNPWICRRELFLNLRSVWMDYGYLPIARTCLRAASIVRRVQSGSVQLYVAFIFLALLVTLVIAL